MIGVWQIIGWRHFRNTSNLNFQCPFPFTNNIPPIITEPASQGRAASSTLKRGLLPGARPPALSLCVYPDAAQGPRKHQRNRKNFSYSHVCLSVMHQEPVRGPWWVPTIPCAFWLFFFFFKPKYLWVLLAGLWREAVGRKATLGIKNDKALSFDTAVRGS